MAGLIPGSVFKEQQHLRRRERRTRGANEMNQSGSGTITAAFEIPGIMFVLMLTASSRDSGGGRRPGRL